MNASSNPSWGPLCCSSITDSESTADQLKTCTSNQTRGATKPASAVRLFTTYFTAGRCEHFGSCTGLRPYLDFGYVDYRTNDSNSTFHALILSSQRHLRSGFILGTNYSWSHAINDGSLGGAEADIISAQNPFCRACSPTRACRRASRSPS